MEPLCLQDRTGQGKVGYEMIGICGGQLVALPHRACAAFRAIAFLCSGVSLSDLALPPSWPPTDPPPGRHNMAASCFPANGDYEVTVAFNGESGIRKPLLSFAPLERIKG